VGAYLRYGSSLPARLNEFAIIINARHWGSKYEWYAHRPLAEIPLPAGIASPWEDPTVAVT
jgi:4-carboxymuconolactone decarboxylase